MIMTSQEQGFGLSTEREDLVLSRGMKLREIERLVIMETLKTQEFNRTHAAKALGIGIRTLQRKLKKYGAAGIGLEEKLASA